MIFTKITWEAERGFKDGGLILPKGEAYRIWRYRSAFWAKCAFSRMSFLIKGGSGESGFAIGEILIAILLGHLAFVGGMLVFASILGVSQ
jgi:cytosine/uracil/thiamine/allantoin permease